MGEVVVMGTKRENSYIILTFNSTQNEKPSLAEDFVVMSRDFKKFKGELEFIKKCLPPHRVGWEVLGNGVLTP